MDEVQVRAASPTKVDDVTLEYITVDKYLWPKYEQPKRQRLNDEERRRRHREGQRQFMSRKRCRVAVLRRELALVELHLKWVKAREEQTRLVAENRRLLLRLCSNTQSKPQEACWNTAQVVHRETFVGPAETDVLDGPEMENLLVELLLSW